MNQIPYELRADDPAAPPIGLIVLQTDETIEPDFARSFAGHPSPIYAARIPCDEEVTPETLGRMGPRLTGTARLLPDVRRYAAVGYGCTSASALIGSDKVADMVRQGCDTAAVTDPLHAATACARDLGVSRFALVSPYIESVNQPLRAAFARNGISTDVFGSFNTPDEASVVRVSTASIVGAAVRMGSDSAVDAVFLSCTNLRTYDAIPQIRARLGKPVLSSNQALAWHLKQLVAAAIPAD